MHPIVRKLFVGELSWTRIIRSLFLIPVFVYLGILGLAWFLPNKLLFRPQTASYADGETVIRLKTEDGETISAQFYENPAARFTILFSHGNAEDIGRIEPFVLKLRESGFSVLVYDYHGYGKSSGSPSEENAYRDINAAFRYLIDERNIPADRIILHGRSLGGGPSADLASRESVAGLILESTFTSAARVLTRIRVLPFDKFENISKLASISCPILVIHGEQDATIPFHHGQDLFEVANEPKSSLWIENAGHNNVFNVGSETYLESIHYFAESLSK